MSINYNSNHHKATRSHYNTVNLQNYDYERKVPMSDNTTSLTNA